MRGLRYLVPALTAVATLALLAPPAFANSSGFTATLNRYSGQDQMSLNCGTMAAAFGFNGEAYNYDQYRQWSWGTWSPGITFPAGATVLDATVWGSVAEGGPWVAPAQPVGLSVTPGQTAAMEGNGAGNCNFGYGYTSFAGVSIPGNTSSVAFSLDAYAVAQSYATGGTGPWWDFGAYDVALGAWHNFQEIWLVPTSPMSMSVEYAFEPAGTGVGQVFSGNGTQVVVRWNPNGNWAGTTYTLQRQTVTAAGPLGWGTIYQGAGTGFQTADQRCGVGYRYRVAVIGAHAQTAWDQSSEWDEYPCSLSLAVPSGSTSTIRLSWPEVTPGAQYTVVWCQSSNCTQQHWNVGGATSAELIGLVPNTDYTVWACGVANQWGCPAAGGWTYAAVPALSPNNDSTGLSYDQQPFTWSANGNPVGTRYQFQQGWYNPAGAWQGGAVVYDGTATAFTVNQSAGSSYSYNVWAISTGYGTGSAASNGVRTQVASTPTLTVSGPSTATVSWSPVAYMTSTGVACQEPAGGAWVPIAAATGGATSAPLRGLQPNTRYYCATWAIASNQGIQWWQGTGSPYTSAAAPTAGTDTPTQTTLAATWGSGGNPAGTQYQVVLDEAGTDWAQSATTTNTNYTFTGVRPGEPAWVYVQAVGVGALPTSRGAAPAPPDSPWITNPTATTVPMEPTLTGADGGLGWSPLAGRGYVTLTWPASQGATGYTLAVWDGATYETFDLGAATSWDSRTAGMYPTDQSLYPNTTIGGRAAPLFAHNGGGLDLRDRPGDLYCSTGTAYCTRPPTDNFWFTVAARNAAGSSASYQVPGTSARSYYEPTLTLQTDPASPTITAWSVNDGGAYTYAQTVDYSLTASAGASGIAAYALSNDGSTWQSTALPGCVVGQVAACRTQVIASGTWTLLPGPGSKSVWAKVESTAGVWGPPQATAVYINVDQAEPTVDVVLDGGAASTPSNAVTVGVTVSDPVSLENGALTWQARYSTDGGQTWSAWDAEGAVTHWSVPWPIPAGPAGERSVLVQARNSDNNLGQGGATIYYVAPDAAVGAAVPPGGDHPCTWVVNGSAVPAICVTSSEVTVPLQPPPGAVQMRISLEDVTWGPWRPTAADLPLDLGSGPGAKTVWVQFRDGWGAVIAEPPVYYLYDPGAPTVRVDWLGEASATDGNGAATLLVQATDDVGAQGLTLQVTENGATLYSGACLNSVPLTLSGAGYQMVRVRVSDAGGNATETVIGIYAE